MPGHDELIDCQEARMKRLMIATIAALAAGATAANAADIKVLCSGGLKLAMGQLLPGFEKASGNKVTIDYGTAAAIAGRAQKGEPADVVIASRAQLEMLEHDGKVAAGSRVNIASLEIGVAVRKGAPKPDIGSVEAFKHALVAARSITYRDPAVGSSSGIYLAGLVERLGLAQQLKGKTLLDRSDGDVEDNYKGVATGEIELALGQTTELVISGLELVGPLPAEIQNVLSLAAGISTNARSPEAARALIESITSPAAAAILKADGYRPG
jgi:molybdate transport system substrate-binding protein